MALKVGNGKYKKKNNNDGTKKKFGWEPLIGVVVFLGIRAVLPFDAIAILSVALFALSLLALAFVALRDEEDSKILARVKMISFVVLLFAALSLLYQSDAYVFLEKEMLPFWEISLAVGVICGALFALKMYKLPHQDGKGQIFAWIFLSLLVVLMITLLVSSAISTLNYLLDESEPTEIVAIIEGKDHVSRRKGPDSYELEFILDGRKISIDVPSSVYRDCEIGDLFTFYRYEGKFGKPFYMATDHWE